MKNTLIKIGLVLATLLFLVVAFYFSPAPDEKTAEGQEGNSTQEELFINVLESEEIKQAIVESQEKTDAQKERTDPLSYWHKVNVDITYSEKEVYVVLLYTKITNTPIAALLYGPDYSYFYSSIEEVEDNHTQIVFRLQYPERGIWHILLLDEIDLGTYSVGVYSKEEYDQLNHLQEEEEIRVVEY